MGFYESIYSYTPFYYDIHTILLPIYTLFLLPIYTLFAKYTHFFCLIYTPDYIYLISGPAFSVENSNFMNNFM